MAEILLGNWCGYKYVYIDYCPIREIQDYIIVKLIQNYNCRVNSPKVPLLNLVNSDDTTQDKMNVYNELNKKNINVCDKNNWFIKNNVLFLKLGKTILNKEINLMMVNSQHLYNISHADIYNLIKDALLYYNYEINWS